MSPPQRSKLMHALRAWKAKAIARRQENEALKKRLAELASSRDTWKAKAQATQARLEAVQAAQRHEKNSVLPGIAIASRRFKP